ncbi:MAG: phosphoribosylamine--glycine ligase [Candidatus Izemoplasmatales bacterium]|nr:phosphoribosylamine--glycine ligase [Candidatus Izemoplasmatales bacterium]
MKILIIGGGGREHAIAWKIHTDDPKTIIFAVPGNGGMDHIASCVPLDINDHQALLGFAIAHDIDLTLVGGEEPLSKGIIDLFSGNGLKTFGPTQKAAQIESSKRFAKDLMKNYDIPTAAYQVFDDYEKAIVYIDKQCLPIVIKADGLAAGKGVIIAMNHLEARTACQTLLKKHRYIVVEEYLQGIEFSLMAFVNGNTVVPMAVAQDYKRVGNGGKGPNTGGMGAYSPVPSISRGTITLAVETIMKPIAKAMVDEGIPFTGILYGGLMKTPTGVKVIEFNARFGDPETEVVLVRMKSKLVDTIFKILNHEPLSLRFAHNFAVGVVLASDGYPNDYEKGKAITIPQISEGICFHMGTQLKNGIFVNSGGRVLIVVAAEPTLALARKKAYESIASATNESLFYREDIGL